MTKLSSSVHLLFILLWFHVSLGVRKFIRNTKTKAFLAKDGGWTNDVESAVEFYNDEQVRESREVYRLKYCQLYYCIRSNPSKLDFAFSLARWAKCIGTSLRTKSSKLAKDARGSSKTRRPQPNRR